MNLTRKHTLAPQGSMYYESLETAIILVFGMYQFFSMQWKRKCTSLCKKYVHSVRKLLNHR